MSQFLCLGTFLMFHCKALCEIAPTRLLFICSRNDVLLKGYINVKSGFTFISLASNSQSFKICPDLFSSSVVQVQHSCGRACSMLLLWPSYPTIVTWGRFSPKLLLHLQSWTFSFGKSNLRICSKQEFSFSFNESIPCDIVNPGQMKSLLWLNSQLACWFIRCPFDVVFYQPRCNCSSDCCSVRKKCKSFENHFSRGYIGTLAESRLSIQ